MLDEFAVILGVIVAFAIIIFLIRKRFNFGLSLIIGSIILGVFSLQKIQPIDIPKAMIEATIYSFEKQQIVTETIELAILMTLIYVLARAMQETVAINKLISSLRTFFSRGGILGIIPSIYGLMPNPGGAILSAPMIDEEGKKYNLTNDQKNLLNIWFRHIWETVYPAYPAMILICSVTFSNINIFTLSIIDIPAFLTAIFIGAFFLNKFIKKPAQKKLKIGKNYSGLVFILPPIVPLFFYIVLQVYGFSQTQSFLIGIIFSIILLYLLVKISAKEYLSILKKSLTWKLVAAIFGIMIFRQMFEITGANVDIASMVGSLLFSALAIVIIIPFLLGFLIGYNLGAIALSYFLVQPFFVITGFSLLGLTSIIFISAFAGYVISPIHLCNVLSSDYLRTDTTRIYKWFIPAALAVLVVQIIFIVLFPSL